ncbi:PAS domain-containing sensor histidine kinase [Ammoniphilus sp. CFH 90114]|uniref:sensor histidine kinase n=1 Tax=Ammoniphilus sp. CFH 90114 TaxID=2493665 RepID=UPI00100F73F5|nr:HAMP domain-containing sensor histidine kinase [Ammoniphilus sp. CFH 90114]RXT06400.1 HAMP domain-containing histidine kinase [Ammoniphilus sp. CFH 90114]
MAIVLLAVWILGGVIWFTDGKRISTRWASATAFIGGFGFLAGVIDEIWLPYFMQSNYQTNTLLQTLDYLSNISSYICQAGLPYAFLMFAVYSQPEGAKRLKKHLSLLLFIPILITWYVTPIIPELQFHYGWMVLWVVPYILVGSYLIVMQFVKERDPIMKRSHVITIILCVIPVLFVMVTIYIFRTMGLYDAWKYNLWIIAAQFILFLIFSLKYGVLGVKIRVERHRLDTTFRAMTSGAEILNHSVKNEVGKVQLYAHRIENYAEQTHNEALQKDVRVIMQSTEHLLAMVQRIRSKMQDITLQENSHDLVTVIKQAVSQAQPIMASKQANVIIPPHVSIRLQCDAVHLHEVFTNLVVNAVEALREDGVIKFNLYTSKRYLVVSVEDNGSGISKENLPFILDPFFSTKKNSSTNFGLGLSYCYNVMRKHGGLLEVHSEKNQGTTVFLYFPLDRLVN